MTGVVVCSCGHAGRLHGDDGCRLCDCSGPVFAEVEVEPVRCPKCGHGWHSRSCVNLASDNDCACLSSLEAEVADRPMPPATAEAVFEATRAAPVVRVHGVAIVPMPHCSRCHRPLPHNDAEQRACQGNPRPVPSVEDIVAEVVARRDAPAPELVTRTEPGAYPCPTCPRTFDTPQGVGPHRRKAHGYRKGDAPAPALGSNTVVVNGERRTLAVGYVGRHRAPEEVA